MNEEKKPTQMTLAEDINVKVSISKLFTREAYARYLGVSSQCVYERIKKRELKTIPINGADLIYVP